MSARCVACDKEVSFGKDLCLECYEVVLDYNFDLYMEEDERELPTCEPDWDGEEI